MTGEVGVYTRRNPDTVRGVDAAYISNERFARANPRGFLDVAPELIVEVMSPGDTWSEIHEKLEEYFNIDVQVIWIVDPRRQCIHIYRSIDDVTLLSTDDTITEPNVLPGFSASVAEIFDS